MKQTANEKLNQALISALLDIRKTSRHPGPSSSGPEAVLSDGGVPIGTSRLEKQVMDAGGGSGVAGILRKSSLNQTALISMTDSKGIITYANEKFVEVSGFTYKELIGQNHRILKSGQQSDDLFDNLWATISQGLVWHGEIKNRAKNGSYYWVDTTITPIIGDRDRPESYIAIRFLITR